MACADAIWQCFIQLPGACEDETCLMNDTNLLFPRETSTFTSKPGFHRMHQLIGHAAKFQGLTCLEDFVSTKPTIGNLRSMVDEITQQFVATHQIQHMRRKQEALCNIQFENSLLMNKYFLLYEELSYAMNCGDIGRAIRKYKYAIHMQNFLTNVHFIYPPGLRQAVHYHILVNPTGEPMKWRAVDWQIMVVKVQTGQLSR
ncbi:hypothetical protein HD554DRAFT_2206980 [Boletus coccyginus]|nr:hypothetical protein HD554DRAFT_2206980 [Boletus coccyginus]